jgi:sugar phosphate permease
MNSKRAWLVVSVGTFAYLIGVMQRTSLGIAGVDATQRFDVQAAALSSLAVVQIIVYAALQIPVGLVLDRVGPRRLILMGAALMAVGQLVLAFAPSLALAIVGRILLGAGDAMTFISVSRLIAGWFSGRVLPLLTQTMGTVGQLGQLLSALPLSFLLHSAGWTPAFVTAASLSVVAFVVVLAVVKNSPDAALPTGPITIRTPPLHALRESLARPGTQLGFWSHFVTQSSATMFSLLWGFPFLSVALGYGPTGAAALLTLITASAVVFGPVLGLLSARYPYRRSNIVLGIVIAMGVVWIAVLAWPQHPPLWLVVVLLIVIAIGGPGSLIGFDFARTFNPARSLGSATGIVNVGGFFATFVMMLLVGVMLDLLSGGSSRPEVLYSLDSFRLAFLVQFVVVGIGVVLLVSARRRTRRKLHEDEGIQVAPLWVALVRAWRHRSDPTSRTE